MLNVYHIPAKEQQVVGSWSADEISVLEMIFWKYSQNVLQILRKCKKLKQTKIVRFKYSSILNVLQYLVQTVE